MRDSHRMRMKNTICSGDGGENEVKWVCVGGGGEGGQQEPEERNGEAAKAITGGQGRNERGCVREGAVRERGRQGGGSGPRPERGGSSSPSSRCPARSRRTPHSWRRRRRRKGKRERFLTGSLRRPKVEANRTLRGRGSGENGAAAVRRARRGRGEEGVASRAPPHPLGCHSSPRRHAIGRARHR